jgi:hypothetical protein
VEVDVITNDMTAGLVTMRPFVPAKEFPKSLAFYEAVGFRSHALGEGLAHLQLGERTGCFGFLLQDHYVKEFAENFMMHLLVEDLDSWSAHLASLSLAERFDVQAPKSPKLEPWGLRVAYLWDPSGVLWHIAEEASLAG